MKPFLLSHLLTCLLLLSVCQLSSCHDEVKTAKNNYFVGNTTKNNSTTTAPTAAPTPAVTSKPPSSGSPTSHTIHTHEPTKKYIPPPDDNEDDNNSDENNNGNNRGAKIFWTIFCLAIVSLLVYFRNSIVFFFGNALTNTRRYGCKGLLYSFFPCFYRGLSGEAHQPLDQIIFETDEGSYTRSNLREGLI